uniref:Fatty acid amide hydrolase-like isoform X1 n=1 Tax=Tanacetum cinerariifolium TaxID=118510 RepID=A0A6L2LNT3_TANCI|nr:fatty acid amide hydrolase-like isoform X1 [Tanacetum cinerariifolium]
MQILLGVLKLEFERLIRDNGVVYKYINDVDLGPNPDEIYLHADVKVICVDFGNEADRHHFVILSQERIIEFIRCDDAWSIFKTLEQCNVNTKIQSHEQVLHNPMCLLAEIF